MQRRILREAVLSGALIRSLRLELSAILVCAGGENKSTRIFYSNSPFVILQNLEEEETCVDGQNHNGGISSSLGTDPMVNLCKESKHVRISLLRF